MKTYDVVVIGSGMAGMTIAQKCASRNKPVAVTDSRPYGGTCALRGCDPKKVLFRSRRSGRPCPKAFRQGIVGRSWYSVAGADEVQRNLH